MDIKESKNIENIYLLMANIGIFTTYQTSLHFS